MFEFLGCQIEVPPQNMSAIVRTESAANQYAIGIVGHYLSHQPQTEAEAQAISTYLAQEGINYSVGLAQVNQSNFQKYRLKNKDLFNPCENLRAGSEILRDCYNSYKDWNKAYSCYYSGNAITGFRHGYVYEVLKNLAKPLLTEIAPPDPKFIGEPIVLNKITKKGNPKNRLGLAAETPHLSLKARRMKQTSSSNKTLKAIAKADTKPMSLSQRRLASSLSN